MTPTQAEHETHAHLVSVIMAAHNAEKTILESIGSVLGQTHEALELLICDDASTDRTAEIAASIADARIRLFRNSDNLGPGGSRDRLIANARGRWLAFIDADDIFKADRLERLLDLAPAEECLLFDDILECHHTPNGLVPWRRVHGRSFGKDPAVIHHCSLASLIGAKRFLIKPVLTTESVHRLKVSHPNVRYAEDGGFFWTLVARGVPAFYVPQPLYLYRITPGSASSSRTRHQQLVACLELLLDEDISDPDRKAIRRRSAKLKDLAAFKSLSGESGLRRWYSQLSFLVFHPTIVFSYAQSIPTRVVYHLKRLRSGGARR